MPLPFNDDIHTALIQRGFFWFHMPAEGDFMADYYYPGYDEYLTADERVIIDDRGHVCVFENRDLEFDAWCDEMQASCAA